MKKNPRFLFWNTPSTCSLSCRFQYMVNNKKSMWSGILQCKQDDTIWMMKFKNCVRYFQGYSCMSLVFQCKPDETIRMMKFKNCVRNFQGYRTCMTLVFQVISKWRKDVNISLWNLFHSCEFFQEKKDEVSINISFLLYTDISRRDQNSSTVPFYLRQNRSRGFILIHQSC